MDLRRPLLQKLKIYLIVSIVFLFSAIYYSVKLTLNDFTLKAKSVQSTLVEKEKLADQIIDEIAPEIENRKIDSLFLENIFRNLFNEEDIILLIFKDSILRYWSDNSVSVEYSSLNKTKFNFFSNAWFEIREKVTGNYRFIVLIKVKNDFIFENQYLKNSFPVKYKLPSNVEIITEVKDFPIYNKEGDFLFSIVFPDEPSISDDQSSALFLLYLLSYIFLLLTLYYAYQVVNLYFRKSIFLVVGLIIDILLIRWITIYFEIPGILHSLKIFKPMIFASSNLFPSLGDLLVNSITILAISFVIFKNLKLKGLKNREVKFLKYVISLLFLSVIYILFYALNSTLGSIITDSNISFDLFNITSISLYSVIGLLCFGVLILSFILLTFEISIYIVQTIRKAYMFFPALLIFSIGFFLFCWGRLDCNGLTGIILFIYLTYLWKNYQSGNYKFKLSLLLFFLIIFAILSAYITFQANYNNEKNARRILGQKLSDQRDYSAEFLFNEIYHKAKSDSLLINLLTDYPRKSDSVYFEFQKYFKEKYFSRYWDKYELLITLCDSTKLLNIQPENYTINCHEYFNDLINEYGISTSFEHLIFLKFNASADNYIGIIDLQAGPVTTRIYIEVFSKLIPRGLGYPELLMDHKTQNAYNLTSYSWARYDKDEIIYHFGKFTYSMNLKNYINEAKGKEFFDLDTYNHLLIEIDKDSTLIISKKNPGLIDIAAPLSYFFIFYGVLLSLIFFIYKWPFPLSRDHLNFKIRLQWSVISLILFSFILIGISSIFYIINFNNTKNRDLLSEKSHSVLIELEHKLAMEESLTSDLDQYLSDLLYKLSLVFFSDINLYGLNGELLAASRPDVFNNGLISMQIHPQAFNQMINLKSSLYIQNESIGKYKYLSAYLPFRNERNKPIAYLNLPYFAKQDDLTHEISTYLVTFINIYVILTFIAILITLIFSNYLTKPIQLIREKIGRLKLGKQNEKIDWARNDEIGSLVLEYNRMVDELAKSAEQLAKSERESAWREMAKQIAHEIKNPLTPMKLSVQYLQKAWEEKTPDWEQRLKRFTQTLIEQIDSLSNIATEFSDFATMPKSKFEKLELSVIVKNAVDLYKDTYQINFEIQHKGKHFVLADKEQLMRVFINLINNSLQAIAEDNYGLIKISIEQDAGKHVIRFTDNGKGITDEQKSKVFYPNFTTKSGGMGMGLAVVKNIIQNSQGEITFESEERKGTTFIIILPDYKEEKKGL